MLGHGCEAICRTGSTATTTCINAGVRCQRYPRLKPLQHDLFTTCATIVLATNSGMAFEPASIKLMIEVMGEDRVMYAMDYPYQYLPDEVALDGRHGHSARTEEEVLPDQCGALVQALRKCTGLARPARSERALVRGTDRTGEAASKPAARVSRATAGMRCPWFPRRRG